jgi:hypothetical protein
VKRERWVEVKRMQGGKQGRREGEKRGKQVGGKRLRREERQNSRVR